ncbi:Fis family transcriptional regulator [Clostridiales bacterium PH28_bin88]|nr:Fis family transcriptional regulator [Clostridiales bacterium PH28_bin88]
MVGPLVREWTAEQVMITPVVVPSHISIAEARQHAAASGVVGLVALTPGGDILGALTLGRLDGLLSPETPLSELLPAGSFRVVGVETPLREVLSIYREDSAVVLIVKGVEGQPVGIVDAGYVASCLWEHLRLVESRLGAVVDTVNEAVTIIDPRDVVVGWNRRAEELYNIPASEIIGRPIESFFTSLVVTRVMQDRREVRNAYHQPCEGTHVLINATPIRLEDQVVGSISAERDITELVYLHEELSRASTQVRMLEKEINKINGQRDAFHRIIGHSRRLAETITLARRVANTNAAVLVRGESGTGKELFAEAIHQESQRRDRPFVVINCGAIPPTLFESELFGYQAGAFTGADRRGKPGKFELANGGTLFLDEIGELQPDMQVKLLRVLQNKVFYRVGGSESINVDVRVIAATHRDLEGMITQGLFREDLYYRLNVVSLEVPPLRERKEDIPELVYMFIQEFARVHLRQISQVAPEVMSALLSYSWPGNVRELRNMVERLVILAEGEAIKEEYLPESLRQARQRIKPDASSTLAELTFRTEREIIAKALEKAKGNKALAARQLGIPRSTLYYKMKALQIT